MSRNSYLKFTGRITFPYLDKIGQNSINGLNGNLKQIRIAKSMQVITTHLNIDFDCLASMMAVKKLYPEAHLVLQGSAEGLVEEFLKEM